MADVVADLGDDDPSASEHEALLQFLYVCPHGLAQFDRDGTILMLNPAFACLTMPLLPPGGAMSNLLDVLEPWLPELRDLMRDPRARGTICDGTRVHLGPASPGQDPGVLSLTVVRMDAQRHMAVLSDVTRQVAHERRLQESEAWFAAVVQGADDYAVLSLDAKGLVSGWNMSGERMFGHAAEAVIGRHAGALAGSLAGSGSRTGDAAADAAAFDERLREAGRDGWHLDEGWRTRADGSRFWGTCMVSPVEIDPAAAGAPSHFLMVVRDVTERRHSARELRRALSADHLTGVLNRRSFLERAERKVSRGPEQGAGCCMAMVDVDHFKSVNDSLGHAAGDAVLSAIAEVLRGGVRDGDLVGRLGGEEFGVLMPRTEPGAALALAEGLRAGIAALRLSFDGQPLRVTASIGVSVGGKRDLRQLMVDADAALYEAKRGGRDRVCRAAEVQAAAVLAGVPAG